MTKKEDYSLLKYCPQEFNVDNYNLSTLFCYAAFEIEDHISKRINKFSEENYLAVRRVGRILYRYGEEAKIRRYPQQEDIFLEKIFRKLEKNPKTFKDIADPTIELGLEFIKMKKLSGEKQEKLKDISLLFSRIARAYWQESNPNGFKRYTV